MAYMSDRQRAEIVLITQMMWAVMEAGVGDRNHPDFAEFMRLIRAAMEEAVAGLDPKAKDKLARRAGRAHLEVTAPYRKEGDRCDKVALIVYFLVMSVTECGYLEIGKGSNASRALNLYIPAIDHMALEPDLFRSGRKHARKVLEHLQRLGLFGGVPFVADAEPETEAAA